MDEDGIIKICATLGLKHGRAYAGTSTWGSHISISCPLAVKTHGDPHDDNTSCSVEVVPNGPSRAKCWSANCRFKGSLLRLLQAAIRIRGTSPEYEVLLKDVEAVEGTSLKAKHNRLVVTLDKMYGVQVRERDVLPESVISDFSTEMPDYAMKRGITNETARRWGLLYDANRHFLVFPVRRTDGALVGLVGRAVSEKAIRRHHNYMGLDKSKHIFGAHMMERGRPVVIVESCIDALNVWQALEGAASVVATLGEGFSSQHALTIESMGAPSIYIFTDGDDAGRLMAEKIYHAVKKTAIVKLMECPRGPAYVADDGELKQMKVDPSNLPYAMIREIFVRAPKVFKRLKWSNPSPIFDPATVRA